MSDKLQTFCMIEVLTSSLMCVCVCVYADYQSDSDSFNPTLWEEQRQQRMTVAFDFEDKKEEEDNSGKVKVSPSSLLQSVLSCLVLSVCLSNACSHYLLCICSAIAIIMSLRIHEETLKISRVDLTSVTSWSAQ